MFYSILVLLDFMWFMAEKLRCRNKLFAFIYKYTYIRVRTCTRTLSVTIILNSIHWINMHVEIGFPITSVFAYISYVVLLKGLINILQKWNALLVASGSWFFFFSGKDVFSQIWLSSKQLIEQLLGVRLRYEKNNLAPACGSTHFSDKHGHTHE